MIFGKMALLNHVRRQPGEQKIPVLNAEIAALELVRNTAQASPRVFKIAAEDEIDGLGQRSAVDLGRSFIELLHRSGRAAADRWLKQDADPKQQLRPSIIPENLSELAASVAQFALKETIEADALALVQPLDSVPASIAAICNAMKRL